MSASRGEKYKSVPWPNMCLWGGSDNEPKMTYFQFGFSFAISSGDALTKWKNSWGRSSHVKFDPRIDFIEGW